MSREYPSVIVDNDWPPQNELSNAHAAALVRHTTAVLPNEQIVSVIVATDSRFDCSFVHLFDQSSESTVTLTALSIQGLSRQH